MSNSIKDALKKLCLKLTGKKSNKESINGVIDDITENYSGGSETPHLYANYINLLGEVDSESAFIILTIISENVLTEETFLQYISNFDTTDRNSLSVSGYAGELVFVCIATNQLGDVIVKTTDDSDETFTLDEFINHPRQIF